MVGLAGARGFDRGIEREEIRLRPIGVTISR
jgi:hypothetical protein